MYRGYWNPWYGPCRCGYGPHAYAWWHRVPPVSRYRAASLEELEELREWLKDELKSIENEIEKLKSEKNKKE